MLEDKNKKILRCSLIFLGPYPHGNVSSIRIHSYCKALAKRGIFIKIILLAPCREASINTEREGIYQGVHYKYMTKITWEKRPNFFIKLIYYLTGLLKSIKEIRNTNTNCLLSYHSNFISNVFFWCYTRFHNIPFIIDKTEYPYGYQSLNTLQKKFEIFKLLFFDGFITITKELMVFYSSIKSKVFHLPMSIDIERFNGLQKQYKDEPYIAVVFGSHNRDGLFESIISYYEYTLMCKEKPYKLTLIGDFNALPNKKEIIKYINEKGLLNRIQILGKINIQEVPQLLINASCLLTTPNEYKSGGFPTKLGEYMLSGVPVVATYAGEISNYVTDQKNILVCNPKEFKKIASNIIFVQNNTKKSIEMASNAKLLVLNAFNADLYIDKLIDFLINIKK